MRRLIACAFLLAGTAFSSAAAPPTATPGVVTIYASVTDKSGKFVPNLTAADFTLRDNGEVRTIQEAVVDEMPATLVLLVDTSGSMTTQIDRMNEWLTMFVNHLRPSDRLRVGRLATTVALSPATFTTNRPEVAAIISAWGPGERQTPLFDSLHSSLDVLAKEPGYRAVVVLSDGEDTSSRLKFLDVLGAAQMSRVMVHALETSFSLIANGQPRSGGKPDLARLVRESGGVHRRVPKADDREAVEEISRAISERYRITFPGGATTGKLRTIFLRTKAGLMVRVSTRYGSQ